jgi:hypothetical protein
MRKVEAWLVVVLLGVVGCGGGTVGVSGAGDIADLAIMDVADAAGEDGAGFPDGHVPDVHEPADIPAVPDLLGEISDTQADENQPPELGALGDPCGDDAECDSGLCIDHDGVGLCTDGCADTCPEGWSCLSAPWSGVDVMFVCFPDNAVLCRPCLENSDCEPAVEPFEANDEYAFCMSYGVEGTYCAMPCTEDDDCAKGYECDSWFDVDGNSVDGCRKSSGVCDCSDLSIALEAQTNCKVGNEFGACTGERFCGEDGLTDCDGDEAQEETCNALDDNCDGEIDEDTGGETCEDENAYGICAGEMECVEGELACNAAVPAEEECDGLDNDCDGEVDEEFEDTNDNGIVDCLESDLDDDGIFDYDDNCPEFPNPDQENFDQDDLGDACDDDDDNDGVVDDDDCEPFDGAISPNAEEVCNGIDDNCNSAVDDGFPDSNGDGVADCVEEDSDGDAVFDYEDNCPADKNPAQTNSDDDALGDACDDDDDNDDWKDDVDCGPTNPAIYPDAFELCNGLDDNCDGVADEGLLEETCGTGICAVTVQTCVEGESLECVPVDIATNEICDGLDNDCDGATDEELGTISCGEGVCATEAEICVDGAPGECAPLDIAAKEKCDGLDNDCDGVTDEELGTIACGFGECATEVPACDAGAVGFCEPLNIAIAEICDDLDNDCDGKADEEGACHECHPETYGDHLYLFCTLDATWAAAREVCLAEEMDLASSNSGEEDSWMYGKVTAYEQALGWFFGLNDLAVEGEYVWVNGDEPGYTNYAPNEPNDYGSGEDCTSISAYGGGPGWNDMNCADSLPYVCEDIDTDGDGVPNRLDEDDDGDGVGDLVDNCPLDANPEQVDIDEDGFGQPCDDDDDGDGDLDVVDCAPEDPAIFSGAFEACDEVDNNCDGVVDTQDSLGCQTWYKDVDQDTWGIADSACLCAPEAPYTGEDMGDCDDNNALANPDQEEACGDDFDNDCDASTSCFWVTFGDELHRFEPVITEANVQTFYSYSGGSSHTGYEKFETTRFLIQQGPDGAIALVFLNDAVNDQDGGDVDVKIKTGIGTAEILVSDDGGEMKFNKDGHLDVKWKWATCCTDGGVLGPLDGTNGLEIPVEVKLQAGVDGAEMVNSKGAPIPVGTGNFNFTIHKMAD